MARKKKAEPEPEPFEEPVRQLDQESPPPAVVEATSVNEPDGKRIRNKVNVDVMNAIFTEMPELNFTEVAKEYERRTGIPTSVPTVSSYNTKFKGESGTPRKPRSTSSGAASVNNSEDAPLTINGMREVQGVLNREDLTLDDAKDLVERLDRLAKAAGGVERLKDYLEALDEFTGRK